MSKRYQTGMKKFGMLDFGKAIPTLSSRHHPFQFETADEFVVTVEGKKLCNNQDAFLSPNSWGKKILYDNYEKKKKPIS